MEMEKELRADDLFVKKPVKENARMVDPEYEVVVKLSSVGKLGLPAVLHVKDYSFDDTMLFAKANQNNESSIVLQLIKNLVFEDIDLSKVTRQDVVEILMAIQGTYYTGVIDGKRYFIDETLTGEALTSEDNVSTASININDIQTKTLDEKVMLPIKISNSKICALFDYPRLMHDVKAREWIDVVFAERENRLASAMQRKNQGTASKEDLDELQKLDEDKGNEYIRTLTAQQIISFNGETPETIEDKLKLMHKIPVSVLTLLANILSTRFTFGVQDEVSFIDNKTETRITRRFNFRYTDFIPAMEQGNGSGFDVSFG